MAAHVAPGEFEKAGPEVRQMLLVNVPAFQLDYNSRRPPFTCEDARRVAAPALVVFGGRSPIGLQRIAETTALHEVGKDGQDSAGHALGTTTSCAGLQ
jgi:hypothetical protein